jgi:hypothetical protein
MKPKKKNDFGVMTPQEEARFRKEYTYQKTRISRYLKETWRIIERSS